MATWTLTELGWLTEKEISEQFGVSRERLVELRKGLAEGEAMKVGREMVWRKEVVEREFKGLGAAALPVAEVEELVVHSEVRFEDGRHFPNGHVIEGRRAGGGVVVVSVMQPGKFMRKLVNGQEMKIRAKKSGHGTHWELVGREPRGRGVW